MAIGNTDGIISFPAEIINFHVFFPPPFPPNKKPHAYTDGGSDDALAVKGRKLSIKSPD
jgi:hypothetical protein